MRNVPAVTSLLIAAVLFGQTASKKGAPAAPSSSKTATKAASKAPVSKQPAPAGKPNAAKTPATKSAPSPAKAKTAPKTAAAKTTAAKKTTPKKAAAKKRTVARKRTQTQPTPERYMEIQEALIGRGLLQGPATGKWDADSVSALREFQASQKLEPTGKINALSLIRLGLGPKRDAQGQPTGVPPSPPKQETEP